MDAQLPATEITALLGRGTQFEGKLHFEGRVRIDGVFKGEIQERRHARHRRGRRGPRGDRRGDGHRARRRRPRKHPGKTAIEVHAPGKMVGNLHSPSLFIDRGVEFQGSCRMDPSMERHTAKPAPDRVLQRSSCVSSFRSCSSRARAAR